MNAKSQKIFSVTNKTTGKVERLIKAGTRAPVSSHLLDCLKVDAINAVELLNLTNAGLVVEAVSTNPESFCEASGQQVESAAAVA